MPSEIFIEIGLTETRIAVRRDGRLEELLLERPFEPSAAVARDTLVGSVFLGRVQRVVAGMNAAFVEIGMGRAGFLAGQEAWRLATTIGEEANEDGLAIGRVVTEGQAVLVQVVKDPIGGKGARLTSDITLPGRLVVLVPLGQRAALSRRIPDEAERARLQSIVDPIAAALGCGLIVRTAAVGADEAELRADAEALAACWDQIRAGANAATPPARLFSDLDPVRKVLRDRLGSDTHRVVLDDGPAYGIALDYARRHAPALADRLELARGPGLFEAEGLEQEIERASRRRVGLPSGGWITIEATEALTAIDVNSGRFAEAGGLSETSRRVNREAAEEIPVQLRLRGIGGLVAVDFIHMAHSADAEQIVSVLKQGFASDGAPTDICWVAEFGVAMVTRKRIRPSLQHRQTAPCAMCEGTGRVPSAAAIAGALLRRIEREAVAAPGRPVMVRAAPGLLAWLRAQPDLLERVCARIGAQVRLLEEVGSEALAFEVRSASGREEVVHGVR